MKHDDSYVHALEDALLDMRKIYSAYMRVMDAPHMLTTPMVALDPKTREVLSAVIRGRQQPDNHAQGCLCNHCEGANEP